MHRALAVIGAPSNIGTRPYSDGESRHVDRAPRVLRERDLVRRISAVDFGDVVPAPIDREASAAGVLHERQVDAYSRALAAAVRRTLKEGLFSVVLGGDCSIVLGCLLGSRRATGGEVGLVYLDAHADFGVPARSHATSAAEMSVALATGRGRSRLAHLLGPGPLIEDRHVVLVGGRADDDGEAATRLAASDILVLSHARVVSMGTERAAASALARVSNTTGFFIHVDVDVLDPRIMSAVGSPEPGGLLPAQLVGILEPLLAHPKALGIAFAVYDPALDPDRSCARWLVNLAERLLAPSGAAPTDTRPRSHPCCR
jgi:arginase